MVDILNSVLIQNGPWTGGKDVWVNRVPKSVRGWRVEYGMFYSVCLLTAMT